MVPACCDTEEDDLCEVESDNLEVVEDADSLAKFRSPHSRDLVNHQAATGCQAVGGIRFDLRTEQRRVGRAAGDRVNGGVGIEVVILRYQRGFGLPNGYTGRAVARRGWAGMATETIDVPCRRSADLWFGR